MYVIICKGKIFNPGIFIEFEKDENKEIVDVIFRSGYGASGKTYKTFRQAQKMLDKMRSVKGMEKVEVFIMPLDAWELWNKSFYSE